MTIIVHSFLFPNMGIVSARESTESTQKVMLKRLFLFASTKTHFLHDTFICIDDQINRIAMGLSLGAVSGHLSMGFHEQSRLDYFKDYKVLF